MPTIKPHTHSTPLAPGFALVPARGRGGAQSFAAAAQKPSDLRQPLPVQRLEWALCLFMCCWLAVAVWAPAVPQPEAYHLFADHRTWQGVPFAMDVLSNAGFLLGGAWGLWWLGRQGGEALHGPMWVTAALFFSGLLLTGVCSSLYHWQPEGAGLMLDRVGMGVAFAGLWGLAVADRIGGRASLGVSLAVLVSAPVSAALAWRGGNAIPWVVLQVGGLLLLLALAVSTPRGQGQGDTRGLPLLNVVLIYALAKGFEWQDHAVYALTHGWLSGHTLKHLVAAGVVWPVWRGLVGCDTIRRQNPK